MIDYTAQIDVNGKPKLLPEEQIFLLSDDASIKAEKKYELNKGHIYLTSHRLVFILSNESVSIPLFYVSGIKEIGVFKKKVAITFANLYQRPSYEIELYTQIYKVEVPPVPHYPNEIHISVSNREEFIKKLKELLTVKYWEKQIIPKIDDKKVAVASFGVQSIKRQIDEKNETNMKALAGGFADIVSLKKEAQKLVEIACQINGKVSKGEVVEGMDELSSVLVNIGMGTPVMKQNTGKEYYNELSKQVAEFLGRYQGIITLYDLYCLYNRARQPNFVSPEDLKNACTRFETLSLKYKMKSFDSGVIVVQSAEFNELTQEANIVKLIAENKSLSVEQLSKTTGINVLILKDVVLGIEKSGHICRDESEEGVLFTPNSFATYKA